MVKRKIGSDTWITFIEDGHRYHDPDGNSYTSVSRVLDTLEAPFEREAISRRMAQINAGNGASEQIVDHHQKLILAEWDKKRDDSLDHGNWIHSNLERMSKTGQIDDVLRPVWDQVKSIISPCERLFPETIFYDIESKICGTADLPTLRSKKRSGWIYDFYDYKTNQQNGIEFNSIKEKNGEVKHYNKFFLPPFDFLESCNYNRYSLQLNVYAYMAAKTYGITVGRLAILYVDQNFKVHNYPVMYNPMYAKMLIDNFVSLKSLPKAPEVKKVDVNEFDW